MWIENLDTYEMKISCIPILDTIIISTLQIFEMKKEESGKNILGLSKIKTHEPSSSKNPFDSSNLKSF